MPSLFRILAVAFAVLWLPLTAHCELEAIEAFQLPQVAEEGCCDPTHGCTEDACEMMEGVNLLPAATSLKAPVEVVIVENVWADTLRRLTAATTLAVSPASEPHPRSAAWRPTWHIAQRATGWVRAPSAGV